MFSTVVGVKPPFNKQKGEHCQVCKKDGQVFQKLIHVSSKHPSVFQKHTHVLIKLGSVFQKLTHVSCKHPTVFQKHDHVLQKLGSVL